MGIVVIQPYTLVSKLKKTKTEFERCTGYLSLIKHYKARFIANSSSCTTIELKLLLSMPYSCYKNILSWTVKRYMRDRVTNLF